MFTPEELQVIFDAVVNYSIRPEVLRIPELDPICDSIIAGAEKQLNMLGYTAVDPTIYSVKQH